MILSRDRRYATNVPAIKVPQRWICTLTCMNKYDGTLLRLASGRPRPTLIALDATNVYWIEPTTASLTSAVIRQVHR